MSSNEDAAASALASPSCRQSGDACATRLLLVVGLGLLLLVLLLLLLRALLLLRVLLGRPEGSRVSAAGADWTCAHAKASARK
jgi:hypothetical protein